MTTLLGMENILTSGVYAFFCEYIVKHNGVKEETKQSKHASEIKYAGHERVRESNASEIKYASNRWECTGW